MILVIKLACLEFKKLLYIFLLFAGVLLYKTPVCASEVINDIHIVSGNWVYENESDSEMEYMAYIPDIVTENTKILLFVHGNGDIKSTWETYFDKYEFVRHMNTDRYIFIIPFERKRCNWQKDIKKIDIIIDEISDYAGAKREGNLYIAGVSAGADAVTNIARKIKFEGAIYMAGSLKGVEDEISAGRFAKLWEGKTVCYYRDNEYYGGGYGYDREYINKLKKYSEEGRFNFYYENLNWDHDHRLLDASLRSEYFFDEHGNPCHGALDRLFGNEIEDKAKSFADNYYGYLVELDDFIPKGVVTISKLFL